MADWKGTKVDIVALREDGTGLSEEQRFERYLDTDTMSDLFDRFPPSKGWVLVVGTGLHERSR